MRQFEDENFVLLDRVGEESGRGALDLSLFLNKWRILCRNAIGS
jgi:hypothetical protein